MRNGLLLFDLFKTVALNYVQAFQPLSDTYCNLISHSSLDMAMCYENSDALYVMKLTLLFPLLFYF